MVDAHRVLLPLDEAQGAVRALYHYRDTHELADALIAVDAAIERSLRLLLRSDRDAPDSLRLAALSEQDVPFDALLDGLRQRDLISIELAGAVHGTRTAAERAREGAVRASDADPAVEAVEGLRSEVAAMSPAPEPPSPSEPAPDPLAEEPAEVVAPARGRIGSWIAVAGAVVVVLVAGFFLLRRGSAFDRGVEAFEQGRMGVAEQQFEAALRKDSSNVTARLYLARILRRQERYPEAADQLKVAATLAPSDADVRRELGHLFFALKAYPQAAEQYRRALEAQPDSKLSWMGLIQSLRAAGDPQAAEMLRQAPADVRSAFGQN